jgi:hypothetical protein
MAAQATLSTAAKRQAQQQGAAQSNGQRGGKGEEDAAKPLKWTCAYSFKYRYVW